MYHENSIDKERVEFLEKRVKLLEETLEDSPWESVEEIKRSLKPLEANLTKHIDERADLLSTQVHALQVLLRGDVQDLAAQVRTLQGRSDATLKTCQKVHVRQDNMIDVLSTIVTLIKRIGT